MSIIPPARGRGWGRALLIVGAGFSVTSNVAHTWLYPRPDGVEVPAWRGLVRLHPDYTPAPWAVAVSALWPLLLFMVIEAMARTSWRPGVWSWAARIVGLLPVGAVAGVVSYMHLSELLAYHGAGVLEATIGPLAIDGAMLMGTVILLLTSPRGEQTDRRPLAVRVAEARAAAVAVRNAARGRTAEDTPEDLPPAPSAPAEAEDDQAEASAPAFRPEPEEAEDLPPRLVLLPPPPSARMELPAPPPSAPVDLPPMEAEAPSGNGHRKPGSAAEMWRQRFEALIAEQPDLTRKQAAELLGTTDRTLRSALNGSAPKE